MADNLLKTDMKVVQTLMVGMMIEVVDKLTALVVDNWMVVHNLLRVGTLLMVDM